MNLEQIFSLCSSLAMLGWLGLVFAPRWHITRDHRPADNASFIYANGE